MTTMKGLHSSNEYYPLCAKSINLSEEDPVCNSALLPILLGKDHH